MNSYSSISAIYDLWQNSKNIEKWISYTEKIIEKHLMKTKGDGVNQKFILLDLGCGTGSVAIKMADKGYEVIGIDKSLEMLSVAGEKNKSGMVQFVCQDITEFELFGTVDIIICFLDTVNHIKNKMKLNKMFSLCKNYLNKGGIMIFDIATSHYFEESLGNNTFFDIRDEFTVIWENCYRKTKGINTANITFFIKDDTNEENDIKAQYYDDKFIRKEDIIIEKVYSTDDIIDVIQNNGMENTGIYSDFTFKKPHLRTNRIFFVAENRNDPLKENLSSESIELAKK